MNGPVNAEVAIFFKIKFRAFSQIPLWFIHIDEIASRRKHIR